MLRTVPLKRGFGLRRAELVLTRETVEVHARSQLLEPFEIPLDDIVGVIDLAQLAEDDAEETVWEEAPKIAYIETGRQFPEPDVMVVFKRPLTLPPLTYGGRKNMGVSRADAKALDVDAIELASKDEGSVARALQLAGVPVLHDPMATLRSLWPVVDDPARIEELTAEKLMQWQRIRRKTRAWSLLSLALVGASPLFEDGDVDFGTIALYLGLLVATLVPSIIFLAWRYRRLDRWVGIRLTGEATVVALALVVADVVLDAPMLWAVILGWITATVFVVMEDIGLPDED